MGSLDTNFIKVDQVAEILGTSKSHAYKVVQQLNAELDKQGYIVIAGKVSRAYFEEKIYGLQGGRINASI